MGSMGALIGINDVYIRFYIAYEIYSWARQKRLYSD
jgi:hypothetical protein